MIAEADGRFRLTMMLWLALSVVLGVGDIVVHHAQVAAWLPWAGAWIHWYVMVPHAPIPAGTVALAVAHALPWAAYIIPVAALAAAVLLARLIDRDRDDEHRRGTRVVDAAELQKLINKR